MELRNLHDLGLELQNKFVKNFVVDDISLPDAFKKEIKGYGDYTFIYKKYMVHMTSSSLDGYIPNSWFYIASYFVDYYNELVRYKDLLLKSLKDAGCKTENINELISSYPKLADKKYKELKKNKDIDSESYKKCQQSATSEIKPIIDDLLRKTDLSENNKVLLASFVSDYAWWFGGKTIDRGDFYVSPVLTLANVVNASHSYIADLCKSLSQNKESAALLRNPNAIIVGTSLPSFFNNVFTYLYKNENRLVSLFEHVEPGQKGSVRYAFNYNGIKQTNFFVKGDDNFASTRKGDFYPNPFVYKGENYYLSQELALRRDNNEVSFYGLKAVIETLYPYYTLEVDADVYVLNNNKKMNTIYPLQQIYYGAPGTGKSFSIDEVLKDNKYTSVRTTFHPDSDYSTFVGCYKPQMETVTIRDDRGFPVKENGQTVYKKEIVYKYSPQAFLKAYVKAWKNTIEPVVLVIEEINRGNCAQIFGDIFQLLDRNASGFSSYPIHADEDIMQYLNEEFEDVEIPNADEINGMYEGDVVEDIKNGTQLLLPNNLYIWATMNTSDQSLFPIDSAFKRRWDWKYVRISEGRDRKTGALIKNTIKVDDEHSYDWWEFLQAINTEIGNATLSEDKKLGFFFCKATDNVIDAELFVAKVVFYLWNDVFKDADIDLFKVNDGDDKPTFDQFYTDDSNGKTVVDKEIVVKFIEKVMKKD